MTPENFCYWLQGWFELNQTIDHRDGATPETIDMIRDHLTLVFDKVTPDRGAKRVDKPDVPTPNGPIEDAATSTNDDMGGYLDPEHIKKVIKELDELEMPNLNDWKWPVAPLYPPTYPTYDIDKPAWPNYPEIICSDKACSNINDLVKPEMSYADKINIIVDDNIPKNSYCISDKLKIIC